MSLFKCKMCGGDLEINEGLSVAECEYCGTKQTVPKAVDENLQNLFNRANTLRIKSEFDKAEKLYEKLIQADTTQSEAYWGLILCKYGIEYVDDPTTFKKVPTCHRTSYSSIVADDDYKSALEHADTNQRIIYEEQAKEIDRIQKDILALALKEETYDVFICYKETDTNGQRTQDSVIANDIYYQLTNEGFKVFYAAITLEGKLGSAYEPIIFAALNSAKVMLAIGTKPEHFNSVWVKNEWSRFLKIIKKDRSKLLIPCYRDMDPYELPDEFAHLQAQDMSKIGFINDIVRGIKKVFKKDDIQATTVVKETAVTGSSPNTAPLLRRVNMFLEDGNWKSADEYCEKVLDIDPENAQAYIGKLLAETHLIKKEQLKKYTHRFDNSNNYKKAMRFADDDLKKEINGYLEQAIEAEKDAENEEIYNKLKRVMEFSSTPSSYEKVAEGFKTISSYKDAAELADQCLEKANELIYKKFKKDMEFSSTPSSYEKVAEGFKTISSYKDAAELADQCLEKANELIYKDAFVFIERYRTHGFIYFLEDAIDLLKKIETYKDASCLIVELESEITARKERAKKIAKRNKKIAIITTAILAGIVALAILLTSVIIPAFQYDKAVKLMKDEKYSEAIHVFSNLRGYKDSVQKIKECKNEGNYNLALALIEEGKYLEAYILFNEMDGYKDSTKKARELLPQIKMQNTKQALKTLKVGDYITIGEYGYSTNNDIEWLVLDIVDGKALVISRYVLDRMPYNDRQDVVTNWSTCSLRMWLNKDFYNTVFSEYEKGLISTTTVLGREPEDATQDNIFLLSQEEADHYFRTNRERRCADVDTTEYESWWLRSYSNSSYTTAAVVNTAGAFSYSMDSTNALVSIRPAMWINLES